MKKKGNTKKTRCGNNNKSHICLIFEGIWKYNYCMNQKLPDKEIRSDKMALFYRNLSTIIKKNIKSIEEVTIS